VEAAELSEILSIWLDRLTREDRSVFIRRYWYGDAVQKLAEEILTDWTEDGLVLIPGMAPVSEGFATVGTIAIILAGAFPLVFVLTRLLRQPLMAVGRKLGINDAAAAGLIASLANSIAMFGLVKDMNERGKVINIAFAVSGAFVFGDHLGFTAGFAPEMIGPMIAGKLVGGISAVTVAMWLTKKD